MHRCHQNARRLRRFPQPRLSAVLAAVALAACGGGSDEPTGPPPAASLSLSGTAATGAAIAAQSVEARCAAGTGTATSAADGRYTISITGGALPCVLRVSTVAGAALHSVALGTGSSATANLTPLTDLVLIRLLGASPATLWSDFSAAKVPAAAVGTAAAAVVALLKPSGADFSAIGDPFSAPLVAAAGTTAGNAYDQALDALKARLDATGTSLADLGASIERSSPTAPAGTISGAVSLPPELLLRAKASNCNSLRSGRYRLMLALPTGTLAEHPVVKGSFNAGTLTFTDDSGEAAVFVPNGNCRYTTPNGELVVSGAGVWMFVTTEAGTRRMGLGIPEQNHALADLAGEWNMVFAQSDSLTPNNNPLQIDRGRYTLDGQGKFTAGKWCDNFVSCTVDTGATLSAITFSAHADGGFTLKDQLESGSGRFYAFRAGGGELMLAGVDQNGTIGLLTRARTLSLPTVGTVTDNWTLTLGNGQLAGATITNSRNTIRSVDVAAGSYVRDSVFDFTTGATLPETLAINVPDGGFTRRLPANVVASDDSNRTVSEFYSMSMRGMGLNALLVPTTNFFLLAVTKAP